MTIDKEIVKRAILIERLIPELLGEQPIEMAGELKVRCPFHRDTRPSLRINRSKQSWYCDPCDKGGDCFSFVQAYQNSTFPDALVFLAERAGVTSNTGAVPDVPRRRTEVAVYDYRDATGTLIYQTVRSEPKDFRQRRPDGKGGWIWNLEGVPRVLYRLPELAGKDAVIICEGEKDVDRCWSLGLPATCNVGGAGKWKAEYTQQLNAAGAKRVRVTPDNDEPGRDHAHQVARSCHAAGVEVGIVELPGLPHKGDVSNFLDSHSKEELIASLKAAEPYAPATLSEPHGVSATTRANCPTPVLVTLSTVTPEAVSFLWAQRLAAGKLHLIVGDPGLGKSTLTLDIAARMTQGRDWPDGGRAPVADVIVLSAEDGLADTVRPRLDALGADVDRVHALTAVRGSNGEERCVSLATDVQALEVAIRDTAARLVVVDPLSAYLGKTDSYKDGEVRSVLMPLADLASRTGVAIVGVMHLGKGEKRSALYRALGSVAFVAAARIVLAVAPHPEDEAKRVLCWVKGNLSAKPDTLAFSLADGRLCWDSQPVIGVDADTLLSPPVDRHERREADDWLRNALADGRVPVKTLKQQAQDAGLVWRTIERAKTRLHVEAELIGFGSSGRWYWQLPQPDVARADSPETAIHGEVSVSEKTLGNAQRPTLTPPLAVSGELPMSASLPILAVSGTDREVGDL
jgi:hypothetical protein